MLRNKKILIVDDEPDIRDILTATLTEMNATVSEAANGLEAFDKLQTETYHYVLTDIRMPGGDGLQMIKKIRTELPYQPVIIVCSGYNDLTAELEKEFNIQRTFTKPFRLDNIIEEFLRK